MAFLSPDNKDIAQPNELSVFRKIPNQVGVETTFFDEYRPISTLTDDSPLEFFVSGQGGLYTDLRKSRLYLRCKVVHADGSPLTDTDNVSIVNQLIHSMFSQIDVTLNGKNCSCHTCFNPYASLFKNLLYNNNQNANSFLAAQMFYKDTGSVGNIDPRTTSNTGLYYRQQVIANSKSFEMESVPLEDIFSIDKYLLNGIDLYLKFYRMSNSFIFLSPDSDVKYRLLIEEATLKVLKVKLDPGIMLAHSKQLESNVAKYYFTKSDVKTQTISQASTSLCWDNIFPSGVPSKVIVSLVSSQSINGHLSKNPFNFENYNVTDVGLYINGVSYPHRPYKLDFDTERYLSAYLNLLDSAEINLSKDGLIIERKEFASGYALYSFVLDPTYIDQQYINLVKQGNTRLEMRFATPLKESVTCIVYSEYPSLIEVDNTRNINFVQP